MPLILLIILTFGVKTNSSIVPLIWGGIPALAGQFPHQAAIRVKNNTLIKCSASILNSRWILTARHCIPNDITNSREVLVGTVITGNGIVYDIEKAEEHPGEGITNDIALVKVKNDIQFSSEVKPIKIENSFIKEGVDVVLSGWGQTEHGETTQLMWTNLKTISNEECRKTYQDIFRTDLCAYHSKRNICYRDSGSSLTKDGKVIGVVSRGFICEKRAPGIFVRVSEFQQWIKDQIQVTS